MYIVASDIEGLVNLVYFALLYQYMIDTGAPLSGVVTECLTIIDMRCCVLSAERECLSAMTCSIELSNST